MPCTMSVWKIKLRSCVVRLFSCRLHSWNLIFRHRVHDVFRNPSWRRTFHSDVNFSPLSFVLRLHFAINVLTVNPFVMCRCVHKIFVRLDSQHPLKKSVSHTCTQVLSSPRVWWSINNEWLKWWGSHEGLAWFFFCFLFYPPKKTERLRTHVQQMHWYVNKVRRTWRRRWASVWLQIINSSPLSCQIQTVLLQRLVPAPLSLIFASICRLLLEGAWGRVQALPWGIMLMNQPWQQELCSPLHMQAEDVGCFLGHLYSRNTYFSVFV